MKRYDDNSENKHHCDSTYYVIKRFCFMGIVNCPTVLKKWEASLKIKNNKPFAQQLLSKYFQDKITSSQFSLFKKQI